MGAKLFRYDASRRNRPNVAGLACRGSGDHRYGLRGSESRDFRITLTNQPVRSLSGKKTEVFFRKFFRIDLSICKIKTCNFLKFSEKPGRQPRLNLRLAGFATRRAREGSNWSDIRPLVRIPKPESAGCVDKRGQNPLVAGALTGRRTNRTRPPLPRLIPDETKAEFTTVLTRKKPGRKSLRRSNDRSNPAGFAGRGFPFVSRPS